jgi:hypothetical protein
VLLHKPGVITIREVPLAALVLVVAEVVAVVVEVVMVTVAVFARKPYRAATM